MSDNSFKYHKYMIKSAPYGELHNVTQNLNKISPLDLQSESAQVALRQYNQEHLALLKIKHQDSTYPLFQHALSSNGHYIDQLKRKSYQVNNLTRQLIDESPVDIDLPENATQLLETLSKKLHTYVDKYYREPNGSQVFIEVTGEGQLNVHIAFTSKNVQLSNFSTGEWNSVWSVNKDHIQGKVSIRSHIFQSGNVQMNHDKSTSQTFQFSENMEDNANKIIKAIEFFDSQVQKNLAQTYEQMPNAFFKHLRRIVPVTKTKMIWNVNALKMNKNLQQTKK